MKVGERFYVGVDHATLVKKEKMPDGYKVTYLRNNGLVDEMLVPSGGKVRIGKLTIKEYNKLIAKMELVGDGIKNGMDTIEKFADALRMMDESEPKKKRITSDEHTQEDYETTAKALISLARRLDADAVKSEVLLPIRKMDLKSWQDIINTLIGIYHKLVWEGETTDEFKSQMKVLKGLVDGGAFAKIHERGLVQVEKETIVGKYGVHWATTTASTGTISNSTIRNGTTYNS